jgi:hypothetical protein
MLQPSPACWYLTSVDAPGHRPKPGSLPLRDGRRTVDSGVALPFHPAVLVVLVAAAVLGHAIAHLVAIFSPATRHAVLAETGHVHWPVVAVVALAASLYAAGSMALRHARAGAEGRTRRADICRWLAPRVAVAPLLLYMTGEAVEPVVGGVPVADLLQRGVLVWGFLTQLLVALLATLLLGWLARTAALVGGLLARPPRLVPEVRRPPRLVVNEVIANAMISGPLPARGPPF